MMEVLTKNQGIELLAEKRYVAEQVNVMENFMRVLDDDITVKKYICLGCSFTTDDINDVIIDSQKFERCPNCYGYVYDKVVKRRKFSTRRKEMLGDYLVTLRRILNAYDEPLFSVLCSSLDEVNTALNRIHYAQTREEARGLFSDAIVFNSKLFKRSFEIHVVPILHKLLESGSINQQVYDILNATNYDNYENWVNSVNNLSSLSRSLYFLGKQEINVMYALHRADVYASTVVMYKVESVLVEDEGITVNVKNAITSESLSLRLSPRMLVGLVERNNLPDETDEWLGRYVSLCF